MGKIVFNCNIVVEGENINNKSDALNALQIMLDDYEDMNSCGDDTTICINNLQYPTYEEVIELLPLDELKKSNEVNKGQTLYGDILDWCRDYYNMPKVTFMEIAEKILKNNC